MSVFTIQAPDGRKLKIEAADQATAIKGAQEWVSQNPAGKKPVSQIAANLGLKGNEMSSNVEMAAPLAPPNPDLMNSTIATVNGLVNGIPIVGPIAQNVTDAIGGTVAQVTGGNFTDYVNRQRQIRQQAAEAAPLASLSGNLAGAIGSGYGLMKALPEAMGMTGTVLQRAGNAALSSQGLYTADQMARGKGGLEATGYGVPALVGAGTSLAASGLEKAGQSVADALTRSSQRSLSKAATVGAPSAADLKSVSRTMFKAVDDSGVTVKTPAYAKWLSDIVGKAKSMRISPDLDPKATGAFKVMIEALSDLEQNGGTLAVSDLHTLRQIAQKAAMSTEGRDATFANMIVDGLDKFITSPGNLNVGGKEAGNTLMAAISTWGRAKRVGLIEQAIAAAQNQASGVENGLRIQFRKLLDNPKTARLFSEAEKRALQDVVRGNAVSNIARLLGTFGIPLDQGRNWLGALGGTMLGTTVGGPIGGLAGVALGTGARKLSGVMTGNAADLAARVAATPNVPVAQQVPNMIPRIPIELLMRGGAMTAANAGQ